ncbi:MAG: GtrA family protein [Brevundimonas sp.]|nr:GtrA family protein [Brevundimonas sp.]
MDARSPNLRPPALSALMALTASPLVRFLAVGVVGLTTDALVFSVFHGEGLSRGVARAISLIAATGVTWTLNRAFTFTATGRRRRVEIARYALVVAVSQGLSYSIFLTISWVAPHLPALVALFTGAVIATVFSFTGQRVFTFRAERPRHS